MANLLVYLTSRHRIWTLDDKYPRLLADKFPAVRVVSAKDKEESLRHLEEAEILYAWSLPEKHLGLARRLKWLHVPSAGVDDALYPALIESDIRITCSRGISSAALADHALGMILCFSRGLARAIRDQVAEEWGRDAFFAGKPLPFELDGKVIGILGFGSIGRELARRARACGMKVHALKRDPAGKDDLPDHLYGPREIREFLGTADFLVVTLPLTRETRGILDAAALEAMKPGSYLVNVARGALVREEALIGALASGHLAGAALDVFEAEPLPDSSPLYGFPNVVLTPHIGGLHPHYLDRATSLFIVNLSRYLKGEPLLHEVDKRAGY